MEYSDLSSDFVVDESGSRLLSESLVHPSSSSRSVSTSHGGGDLSLSELSLNDPPQAQGYRRRPFSLLAQPRLPDTPHRTHDRAIIEDDEDGEGLNETMMPEDAERARKLAERTREEKLQSDLFILKKLNTAFEVYKDALRETKNSTEVCASNYLERECNLNHAACSRSVAAHQCPTRQIRKYLVQVGESD